MYTVLCIGGVGESSPTDTTTTPSGMLKKVTDKLDGTKFRSYWVPWMSEYGPVPKWNGVSYNDAISIGATAVESAMDKYGDSEYILLGYSGGAHIAGNVANNNNRVIGCGLIADPMRQVLRWPLGYGVLGQRPVKGCYLWQIANPNDIICSCDANSPIRSFADLTRGFSVNDVESWGKSLLSQVYQAWWENPFVDWASVASGLAGYLSPYPWGIHTGYDHMVMPGTSLMYTEWLADQLNTWDRWNERPV